MCAIAREKHQVVIGLGANLGPRRQNLESAVRLMTAELGPLLELSRWRETEPLVAEGDDPDALPPYLNGAALFETRMTPREVHFILDSIERQHGRDRTSELRRWQSRLLDLDLLAFDEAIVNEPQLIIPHPEMHKRRFVLEPFCEVWSTWRHPHLDATARELLSLLD